MYSGQGSLDWRAMCTILQTFRFLCSVSEVGTLSLCLCCHFGFKLSGRPLWPPHHLARHASFVRAALPLMASQRTIGPAQSPPLQLLAVLPEGGPGCHSYSHSFNMRITPTPMWRAGAHTGPRCEPMHHAPSCSQLVRLVFHTASCLILL